MKIIVSQQNPPAMPVHARRASKKILIEFHHNKITDKFIVSKSEEFLNVIDKLIRKRKIGLIGLMGQIRHIEFKDVGLLTERTIRVIMQGLSFS